jgi:hypothetical protein
MQNPQERSEAIRKNLILFQQVWDDLGVNRGTSVGVRLTGPELAARLLREELLLGRLPNKSARTLLVAEFDSQSLRNIPGIKGIQAVLQLIRSEVTKQSDSPSAYLVSLVDAVLGDFDAGIYLKGVVTELREALLDANKRPDEKRILWLAHQVRVAHRLRGYDGDGLIGQIFFHEEVEREGVLGTTYPHELLKTQGSADPHDPMQSTAFNALLQAELEEMTDADRFDAIVRYCQRPPEYRIYLFAIHGLRAIQSLKIGHVEFYAPSHDPKLERRSSDEAFGRSEHDAVNAAVAVSGQGSQEDESEAIRLVQKAVDILSFYLPTRTPIEIGTERSIRIGPVSGNVTNVVQSLRTNLDPGSRYFHARRLDELTYSHSILGTVSDVGAQLLLRGTSRASVDPRIATALRAKSKGDDSAVLEDRLLNYWISIESLLTRHGGYHILGEDESIAEVAARAIPALIVRAECSDVGWKLYTSLRSAVGRGALPGVPEDLLDRSQVGAKSWADISIEKFLDTLDAWVDIIAPDSQLHPQLLLTKRFYTDGVIAKTELQGRRDDARQDVIFIYQIRNRIVHSAYFHSSGTAYFAARAQLFASLLIGAVLAHPERGARLVIAEEIASVDRLLKCLDKTFNVRAEIASHQTRPNDSLVFRELSLPAGGRLVRPGGVVTASCST